MDLRNANITFSGDSIEENPVSLLSGTCWSYMCLGANQRRVEEAVVAPAAISNGAPDQQAVDSEMWPRTAKPSRQSGHG